MKLLVVSALLLTFYFSNAQSDPSALRGRLVDPNRYVGVKNSPFLFDDWVDVNIILSSGTPMEGVKINFNGYTQNFESLIEGRIMEIELGFFIGMSVLKADSLCGKQSFLKYLNPKLTNQYPLFIFNGRKHRLIKDFRVSLVENKVETPGKSEKFNSFSVITTYYLMTGAEIESIKLNTKDILQKVGKKEAEAYVREQELDLTSEAGLCQLLTWHEGL